MNKFIVATLCLIGADARHHHHNRIPDAMQVQSGDWYDKDYEQKSTISSIKSQNFNQFDGLWHVGNKAYTADGKEVGGVNQEITALQMNDSYDDHMTRSLQQSSAMTQNFNEFDGLYHVNGKAYDPKDNFHVVGGVNYAQRE